MCVLGKRGVLKIINEKPSESFIANTGFYLCRSKILENLPKKKKFDMDELIQKLTKDKKKYLFFQSKIRTGKIQVTGQVILIYLKKMQKSNIVIVGYGSIGKQYYSLLRKNFKNYQIIIVSKHKKKQQGNSEAIFENH